MNELKNVLVSDKVIIKIITLINNFYKQKEIEFAEADRILNEDAVMKDEYRRKMVYQSNNFAYSKFEARTVKNKRITAEFAAEVTWDNGTTDKNVDAMLKALEATPEKIEKIKINMSASYQKEFNEEAFNTSSNNRVRANVAAIFEKNFVCYEVAGDNFDAEMEALKNNLETAFSKLPPRHDKITRSKMLINYITALPYAALFAVAVAAGLYFLVPDAFNIRLWPMLAFVGITAVSSFIIPVPPLKKAYAVLPKAKEQTTEPLVLMGKNAPQIKAREKITKIYSLHKILALIIYAVCFAASIIIVYI